MRELSDKNFGIAISYLIPGFTVLCGLSYHSAMVAQWLGSTSQPIDPTIGSFLYVLFASLAAGLVVSALRWAIIDTVHHATGIKAPKLDFASLHAKIEPFILVVEANYRFYQFYGNMALAIPIALACKVLQDGGPGVGIWCGVLFLEAVLLLGSRDSLRRYYERASAILGESDSEPENEAFE